jgi:hypothetical protein
MGRQAGIPHDHTCNLRTLEEIGATKVLVVLRHPIARISSGIARRFDGATTEKTKKRNIFESFCFC